MVELGAQSVIYELSSAAYMVRAQACLQGALVAGVGARRAEEVPRQPKDVGWGVRGARLRSIFLLGHSQTAVGHCLPLPLHAWSMDEQITTRALSNLPLLPAQVPLGFSVAASVRVGNALGSGDAEQARTSCISALLCTGGTIPLASACWPDLPCKNFPSLNSWVA